MMTWKLKIKLNKLKKKNKLANKVCDILYYKRYKKSNDSDIVEYDLKSFSDGEEVSNFILQYYDKKGKFTDDERSLRLYYGSLYNTNKIIKEWHIKNLSLYIELRNEVIKAQLYDITMLETIFYAVFNVFNKEKDIAAAAAKAAEEAANAANIDEEDEASEEAKAAKAAAKASDEAANAANAAELALIKALLDLIKAIRNGFITNYEKIKFIDDDNKALADILYQNLLKIKKIALKLNKLIEEEIVNKPELKLNEKNRGTLNKSNENILKIISEIDDTITTLLSQIKKDLEMQDRDDDKADEMELDEAEEAKEAEEAQLIKNIEHFLSIINIELKVLNPLKQLDIFKEACKFYNKGFTGKEQIELDKAKKEQEEELNAKGKKSTKLVLKCRKLQEKYKKMVAAEKKIIKFEKNEIFREDNIGEYPNKNDSFRIFMKEKMEYLNILFEILCNNKNISSLIKSLKTLKKEEDKTDLEIYLDFGSENILDKDSGTFVDNSYMDPPSTNS